MCGCRHYERGTYALATSEVVPGQYITVLGESVWGEYCARRFLPVFDRENEANKYRNAALNALAKAPGANALIDVKISLSMGNCARVEGRPVKLR